MSQNEQGKNAKKDTPRPPVSKSPRRRARELAIQGLYEARVSGNDEAAIEAHLHDAEEFDKADREFCLRLLRGILAQSDALQAEIAPCIDRPFAELSPVEASILLLGTFEFTYYPETPYRVVINECIELAKAFGGTDGHKYVNGVLDKLAAELRAPEVEARKKS